MAENIFSYGTLQSASAQLKTFGRTLEGHPDMLTGYKPGLVKIEDKTIIASTGMTHYQNLVYTGNSSDAVTGMVFMITEAELKQADEYEKTADYYRILVEMKSGRTAWVFISSGDLDKK